MAAARIQQNEGFSYDFQLNMVWKGSHEGEKCFLCVFAFQLLSVKCIVSEQRVSYLHLLRREGVTFHKNYASFHYLRRNSKW